MLRLSGDRRVFAATKPVSATYGIDRLVKIVRGTLREDPLSGDLFCFLNERKNRMKILVWDRNGFWLMTKRLEQGRFERIDLQEPGIEIDGLRLALLLEGIDTRTGHFRRHFVREVRIEWAGPGTFYYQLWYRNTPSSYCTPAAFNLSSGRTLVW